MERSVKVYKIRQGAVLTEINGRYYLIATKEARKKCPYITAVNETGAYIWKELEKGKTEKEIERGIRQEYGTEEEEVSGVVREYIETLKRNGYISGGEE